MEKQYILNHTEIHHVLKRMSLEIAENHVDDLPIVLLGLNERGFYLVDLLEKHLNEIIGITVSNKLQLVIENDVIISSPDWSKVEKSSSVIIVDDVLNSGRTAMLAVCECFNQSLKRIETSFLAVREYRSFPVYANYSGLSVSTTLKDHVYFDNSDANNLQVYLS
jgi:pyrimidine operon attenuation protein/uracil phosphoribosyltransferase